MLGQSAQSWRAHRAEVLSMQGADAATSPPASGESGAYKLEAEMRIGLGRVQLVRKIWDGPIDTFGRAGHHHLELSLLPRSDHALGCFPARWAAHRFEPIGELFLLPAGHILHAKSECRHQNSVVCHFDPAAVGAWLRDDLEWTDLRLQNCLDISSAELRRLLFRIGEEIRTPGFASEALVEAMAAQAAIELSRHVQGVDESRAIGGLSPWRMKLIDERLEAIGAAPSLSELALLCNLSVRHLARAFRVSRGRSISQYVAEHRMDHAKRLLTSGMGVKAVSDAMGFSAPSNFAAAFRRATGEAPRQYQQRAGRSADHRQAFMA